MLEIYGNLWEYHNNARWIAITTNGQYTKYGRAIMGAGCAKEAADRHKEIPGIVGAHVKSHGNVPLLMAGYRIITFPTKNNWKDKANLALIEKSARLIKAKIEECNIDDLVIPRPGCGCGGLDWERDVKPVLATIFDTGRYSIICPPRA